MTRVTQVQTLALTDLRSILGVSQKDHIPTTFYVFAVTWWNTDTSKPGWSICLTRSCASRQISYCTATETCLYRRNSLYTKVSFSFINSSFSVHKEKVSCWYILVAPTFLHSKLNPGFSYTPARERCLTSTHLSSAVSRISSSSSLGVTKNVQRISVSWWQLYQVPIIFQTPKKILAQKTLVWCSMSFNKKLWRLRYKPLVTSIK